jgi:CobQ-like glutamine amidotransferase family enzyme
MWLVAKRIQFGAISPEHLNLNGDLGNLVVLAKRLELRGVESTTHILKGSEDLEDYDFVLLGHGSPSAWLQLLDRHSNLIEKCVSYVNASGSLLAVASGADHLYPALTGLDVAKGNWVSQSIDVDGVIGYKNSDSKTSDFEWHNNALLAQLHGPLFAKNPSIADEFISRNEWADVSLSNGSLDELDALSDLSRKTAFEH